MAPSAWSKERRARAFWAKVHRGEEPEDCWWWTGAVNANGYGCLMWRREDGTKCNARAHQIALLLTRGETSLGATGLVTRHACDNRLCVNPAHLLLGTQADNVADMLLRGRSCAGRPGRKGMIHHKAKLNDEAVVEISNALADGAFGRDLAEKFGVGETAISRGCVKTPPARAN